MSRGFLIVFLVLATFILSCQATCGDRVCTQEYEPLCIHDIENRCYLNVGNYCHYGMLTCRDESSEFYISVSALCKFLFSGYVKVFEGECDKDAWLCPQQ